MNRVDIILGQMKPKDMKRKDKVQSDDFVQEIDMDHEDMALEAAAEGVIQAIKQSDAAALSVALKDFLDICLDKEDEMSYDDSDSEDY